MNTNRAIIRQVQGIPASDGDGVQLNRVIGTAQLNMLDPFLLLDAFGSDKPQDYIGGFPPHPHRGFETVTYMLEGKMRHEDSTGNAGVIESGGVQWMTAGRGIIHSEMPEQTQGLLSGFQLWINLPQAHKMTAPRYQEKSAAEIPIEKFGQLSHLKVIAGETSQGTKGVILDSYVDALYLDVTQHHEDSFQQKIPSDHQGFIYVISGKIHLGDSDTVLESNTLGVLGEGDQVQIKADQDSRYLVIAGKPLNESVERAGPFVMNTKAEIHQAFTDYQNGRLAS